MFDYTRDDDSCSAAQGGEGGPRELGGTTTTRLGHNAWLRLAWVHLAGCRRPAAHTLVVAVEWRRPRG